MVGVKVKIGKVDNNHKISIPEIILKTLKIKEDILGLRLSNNEILVRKLEKAES